MGSVQNEINFLFCLISLILTEEGLRKSAKFISARFMLSQGLQAKSLPLQLEDCLLFPCKRIHAVNGEDEETQTI